MSGGVARAVVIGLYAFGWALLLYATFLIDHFKLFGLAQVRRHLAGKDYRAPQFRTPSLYRVVRHPLYVGWLVIFWAAPTMTTAHLVFAVMTTAYILIAIRLEERDLVSAFGDGYLMNLERAWAWRPDVAEEFARLRKLLTQESALSAGEMALLACATAHAVGDSYCSLAWGTRLAGMRGAPAEIRAAVTYGRQSHADSTVPPLSETREMAEGVKSMHRLKA